MRTKKTIGLAFFFILLPLYLQASHSGNRLAIKKDPKLKSKENKEKVERERQAAAEEKAQWESEKEIIQGLIVSKNVHPDEIECGRYTYNNRMSIPREDNNPVCTPLAFALTHDDRPFTLFLLQHGADPAQRLYGRLAWSNVKSVAMAQLLHKNGAATVIPQCGTECLINAVDKSDFAPALIRWYVQHGVDANGDYKGLTPFILLASSSHVWDDSMAHRGRLLMRAGALLCKCIEREQFLGMGRYNVPQIIRYRIERLQKEVSEFEKQKKTRTYADHEASSNKFHRFLLKQLKGLRSSLIVQSNMRQQKDAELLREHLEKFLPAVLIRITCEYYSTELPYKELEAMPFPSITHNSSDAKTNSEKETHSTTALNHAS